MLLNIAPVVERQCRDQHVIYVTRLYVQNAKSCEWGVYLPSDSVLWWIVAG